MKKDNRIGFKEWKQVVFGLTAWMILMVYSVVGMLVGLGLGDKLGDYTLLPSKRSFGKIIRMFKQRKLLKYLDGYVFDIKLSQEERTNIRNYGPVFYKFIWYLRDKKFLKPTKCVLKKLKKQGMGAEEIKLFYTDKVKKFIMDCINVDEYLILIGNTGTENDTLMTTPRGRKLLNLNIRFLIEEYKVLWTTLIATVGMVVGILGNDFIRNLLKLILKSLHI